MMKFICAVKIYWPLSNGCLDWCNNAVSVHFETIVWISAEIIFVAIIILFLAIKEWLF